MKKLLLTAILAAGVSAGAFAQGTVAFQNFSGATGLVYSNDVSHPMTGAFQVELLYGTVGTAIGSLTSQVIFNVPAPSSGKFFDGAVQTLAGVTAGSGSLDATMNATIAIRAWTGGFATYALAVQNGGMVGETATFNNPTGGGGSPAATAANLVGWLVGNPLILTVPEPSTIALGGLGAAALLLFRRRK